MLGIPSLTGVFPCDVYIKAGEKVDIKLRLTRD